MTPHRRAVATLLTAWSLDTVAAFGFAAAEHLTVWSSLYWSVTTATTVGYGDITPKTTLGHVIAVGVMLTIIPLFAATFSLLTSALTSDHIRHHSERLERRLDHIIRHHPDIPLLEEPEPQ